MNTWWYLSRTKQCRPLPGGPYLPARYQDPTCPGDTAPATATVTWADIEGKPDEFPPEPHQHPWSDIVDTPACFPPCDHGHDISDIGGGSVDPLRDPSGLPLADPSGAWLYPPGVTLQAVLDSKVPATRRVDTQHSLAGGGDLTADRTLSLVNDTAAPGAFKAYGTDATGVRGWFSRVGPAQVYEFAVPVTVWVITHNLGVEPAVRTIDEFGREIFGNVTYPTLNRAEVSWGSPTVGRALVT